MEPIVMMLHSVSCLDEDWGPNDVASDTNNEGPRWGCISQDEGRVMEVMNGSRSHTLFYERQVDFHQSASAIVRAFKGLPALNGEFLSTRLNLISRPRGLHRRVRRSCLNNEAIRVALPLSFPSPWSAL